MNKAQFFDLCKEIKKGKITEKAVDKWLKDGDVPGAVSIEGGKDWDIPEEAWPPYTEARAKNADGIYVSIVKACISRKYPMAKYYKCSQQEFDTYISQLEEAGLITVKVKNGIRYYYTTLKSQEYIGKGDKLNKFVLSAISTLKALQALQKVL